MTNLPLMLLDWAVGVSFIVGAAVTRGSAVARLLWAAVGFGWIARQIRERWPRTAVLLLSQHLEPRYARRLLADQPGGLGYLVKERVSDIAVLVDGLRRVTEGECVLDPTIGGCPDSRGI